LDNCFGQHGWKEFHRNRKDILSEFDKILEQTENRPVQVSHGQAVEAYLRKWLSEFLPKKYAVTSGYIIPNLYGNSDKIYHYDIIIYNQLDAPVLWTEGNKDNSEQGKYRAIPAKHVLAVYEVKSRLTKKNVSEALIKLNQTNDFSEQLHPFYSCGVIFIELKESDKNRTSIIKELIKGKDIFGFIGGMVLRYEGDDTCTALIRITDIKSKNEDNNKDCKPLAKAIDELNIFSTEDGSIKVDEQGGGVRLLKTSINEWSVSKIYFVIFNEGSKSVNLMWSRTNFSQFCIDLLKALDGLQFNDEDFPSFGQVFDNIERKEAPLQSENKEIGKPFLKLKSLTVEKSLDRLGLNQAPSASKIVVVVVVENHGDVSATISEDGFKSQMILEAGHIATTSITYELSISDNKFWQIGIGKIPFRLVYYPTETGKEFVAIEEILRITKADIS